MQAVYVVLLAFAALPSGLTLQPPKLMSVSDDLSGVRKDAWASFVNILQDAETSEITSKEEFSQCAKKHTALLLERVQQLRQNRPELTISPESLLSIVEDEIGAGAGARAGAGPSGALVEAKVETNSTANSTSKSMQETGNMMKKPHGPGGGILCAIAPGIVLFAADRFCSNMFEDSDAILHASCTVSLVIPTIDTCGIDISGQLKQWGLDGMIPSLGNMVPTGVDEGTATAVKHPKKEHHKESVPMLASGGAAGYVPGPNMR